MVPLRLCFAFALGMAMVPPAIAARFCVDVEGIPLQCLYADPGQCQQEAARQGGRCAGNPDEIKTPPGPGQFCVVEAVGALSCIYNDRASCDAQSALRNTACIAATPGPQKVPPAHDPFAIKRPY